MAKDIPGFYFDDAKGKYFRIQQNHQVIPGTGYTKQSVKVAKQVQEEKRRAQRQIRRHKLSKIIRSNLIVTSPIAARLGAGVRQNKDVIQKQYAAGLSRCLLQGDNAVRGVPGSTGVSSFTIMRTGALRLISNDTYGAADISTRDTPYSATDEDIDLPPLCIVNDYPVSHRHTDLLTTIHNSNSEEHFVVSCDQGTQCAIGCFGMDGLSNDTSWMEFDLAGMKAEMIWDIAAAPTAPTLAIATDAGLVIGDFHDLHATSLSWAKNMPGPGQMNACFKDANVVMSGERSGRINFTDARVNQSVTRLLHSSAVVGTLSLHESNHVLAHGCSTTSIYDLRWVRQTPVSYKARSVDQTQHSEAYLSFAVPRDRWSDRYTRGRKVAYSADLDLIAAASTSERGAMTQGYVTLYSARTGKVVDSPLTRYVYKDVVSYVDIKRVRDGPESIFCLSEKRLNEWGYGRMLRSDLEHYGFVNP